MADKKFTLRWKNHANDVLPELEETDEIDFDVTLVAAGVTFYAHRSVLSLVSTYFGEIFDKIPAHRQLCVLMTNVSHEIIADLITYIYCGEVNINRERLTEFFAAAKTLQIKAITEDENLKSLQRFKTMKRKRSMSESGYSADDELSANDHGFDYGKQKKARRSAQNVKHVELEKAPDGYNTIADIRENDKGNPNLIRNGHKYYIDRRVLRPSSIHWRCTKHGKNSKNCKASANTVNVNGIIMVKDWIAKHSHGPMKFYLKGN